MSNFREVIDDVLDGRDVAHVGGPAGWPAALFRRDVPAGAVFRDGAADCAAAAGRTLLGHRAEVVGVYNHIGTFHAIAACNLAEIAMGMLAEATVPSSHRWLPKSMTVQYLAKATTGLRAVAELPELPEFGDTGFDLDVPVRIFDTRGTTVVSAVITIWVTLKK